MTALVGMVAAAVALVQASPPSPPARAELCLIQVEALIAEASQETGRVAGPSWFIRDWWRARRPEPGAPGALDEAERARRVAALAARKAADPDGVRAERSACIDEAIAAGAVPGMGPA